MKMIILCVVQHNRPDLGVFVLFNRLKSKFSSSLKKCNNFVNNLLLLRVSSSLFAGYTINSILLVQLNIYVNVLVKLIQKCCLHNLSISLTSLFADYQAQTGVTESFFTEGEELTNLKKQVSDLQQSRDSLQEQVRTKDEKIEKLVSTVRGSEYDFSLEQTSVKFLIC